MISEITVKTAIGSALCSGSAVVAAIDGDSPVVVLLGIIGGVSLGAIGIYQRMQDGEVMRLRRKIEAAEEENERRREMIRALEDHVARVGCKFPGPAGQARCHGSDAPKALGPEDTAWGDPSLQEDDAEARTADDLEELDVTFGAINPADVGLEFETIAQGILSEANPQTMRFDPLLIIALAQLVFAIFKWCRENRAKRLLRKAHANPHGLAARRLRGWFKEKMPDADDATFAAAIATGARLADDPQRWARLKGLAATGPDRGV
jgi:hypothetical protein